MILWPAPVRRTGTTFKIGIIAIRYKTHSRWNSVPAGAAQRRSEHGCSTLSRFAWKQRLPKVTVSQTQTHHSEDELPSASQQSETLTPAGVGFPGHVEPETPASSAPVLARLPRLVPSSPDKSAHQRYRVDSGIGSGAEPSLESNSQITPDTGNLSGSSAGPEKTLDPPALFTAVPTEREIADSTTELGSTESNTTEFAVEVGPALKFPVHQPDTRIATTFKQLHVNRSPFARLVLLATLLVAAALSYLLLENQGDSDLQGPHIPKPTFANEPKLTTTLSATPTALVETETRIQTQVPAEPPTPVETRAVVKTILGETKTAADTETVTKSDTVAETKTIASTVTVAKEDTPGGKQKITAQGPSGSYQPPTSPVSVTPPLRNASKKLKNKPDRYGLVHDAQPAGPDRLPFVTAGEKQNLPQQANPPRPPRYPSTGQPIVTIFPTGSADYRVRPPAAVAELTGSIEPTTTKR